MYDLDGPGKNGYVLSRF